MIDTAKRLIDVLLALPLNVAKLITPQAVRDLAKSVHIETTRVNYTKRLKSAYGDTDGWTASGGNFTVSVTTTASKLVRDDQSYLLTADGGGGIGDTLDAALLDIAPVDDGGFMELRFEFRLISGSITDVELIYYDGVAEVPLVPTGNLSGTSNIFTARIITTLARTSGTSIRFKTTVATAFEISIHEIFTTPSQPAHADQIVFMEDRKTTGTDGGDFDSGALRRRDLGILENKSNVDWITLAGNQMIVLDIGIYEVRFLAPAFRVAGHLARIQNITLAEIAIRGKSDFSTIGTGSQNESEVSGLIVMTSAPQTFELQHICETTQAGVGFGRPTGFGPDEVYSRGSWRKLR